MKRKNSWFLDRKSVETFHIVINHFSKGVNHSVAEVIDNIEILVEMISD